MCNNIRARRTICSSIVSRGITVRECRVVVATGSLLRFRLDLLALLVRLLIEVEEQGKEDGRVHQQQGGHEFRVSAVEEQHLG